MALKAGYRGIKKYIADKLNRMNPGDSFATDAEIAAAVKEAIETSEGYTDGAIGWGNKNLWKFGSFTGAYSNVPFSLSAGTYTFSFSSSSPVGLRLFYNENDSVVVSGESSFNIVLEQPVVKINYSCNDSIATNVQLEKGSTATAYEPYHASVDESKCDNSVIGNVENTASSAHAYTAGQGFICDGQYRVAKGDGISIGDEVTNSNSDVRPISQILSDLKIKSAAFTETTSANGNIILSDAAINVISARISGCIVNPYDRGINTPMGLHVTDMNGAILANQNLSGTYYYI